MLCTNLQIGGVVTITQKSGIEIAKLWKAFLENSIKQLKNSVSENNK